MVTNNMRGIAFSLVFGFLFASCSKNINEYFINEWDIEDIEFITVKDKRVTEIAEVFKNDGYIIFNKEQKYFLHTPRVNYGGTWYFNKNDNTTFYTVNEEGDTIPNVIETLTKDKLVFQTNDPNMPMKFKLAPRK